jgi:hypothetical protein
MEFGDLFSFDKKIAPNIIKPLYWITLVLLILGGVISFFGGFFGMFSRPGEGLWQMVTSIVWVGLGALFLRVAAEVCLTLFEVSDRLGSDRPAHS